MNTASKAPVRVTLGDVAARHRRLMASERSPVAAPAPRLVIAPAPTVPQTTEQRRVSLTAALARIQDAMRGTTGTKRERLVRELIQTQAALSAVRAEQRAEYDADVAPRVPIIRELLEIIDRYQDAGAPLSDDEVATLDRAARWLESNGGGDR